MTKSSVKGMIKKQLDSEGREVLGWIFYDSLTMVASSVNNLTFFQQTIGIVGRNRTNMKSAGSLPNPQSFLATKIGFKLVNPAGAPFFFDGGASPTVPSLWAIFNQMSFDVKVDPSNEYEGSGPLQMVKSPFYMNNGAATSLGQAILPEQIYTEVKFAQPIMITSNRAFSVNVTLTTPAAGTGYTAATTLLYCYMTGVLRRNS
jgi:hypothetical protein